MRSCLRPSHPLLARRWQSKLCNTQDKLEEQTKELHAVKSELEIFRMQTDSLKSQLEQKSGELSSALTSLGEIQKTNRDREDQLRESRQDVEKKL